MQHEYEKIQLELEKLTSDRNSWQKIAESPSRRLFQLPPELTLGTLDGYSSLVDQLVECMMDLKLKEREIMVNRNALQQFRVSQVR